MQPPQTRFRLRIESGERQGDTIPLGAGIHKVGRRLTNTIVFADASVSGLHAEIRIVGGEVRVVDQGSTNGTRIGGRSIQDERLAHGDKLAFGSVTLAFEDLAISGAIEAEAAVAGTASPARVVAPAPAARGRWQLSVLGAALIGAVVLGWQALRRGGDGVGLRGGGQVAPEVVLAGAVPEEEWQAAPTAPRAFYVDTTFAMSGAASGAVGLGVELAGDEWAFSRSAPIDVRARRGLRMDAQVAVEGALTARVGIELRATDESAPRLLAWTHGVEGRADFGAVQLAIDVLPGYDQARVVVAARGAGTIAVDRVTLVETEADGAAARFLEYEAYLLGEAPAVCALTRGGRTLMAVAADAWSGAGLHGGASARWSVTATDTGLSFRVADAGSAAELRWLVNGRGSAGAAVGREPWLATLGPDGYRSHAGTIDVEQANSFLLGRGSDLMRIRLPSPARFRGQVVEGTLRLAAPLLGEGFELQLSFLDERVAAGGLATRATDAEGRGAPGEALAAWVALLDRYPYESSLVSQAEAAQARLIRAGLARIDEVARDADHADFFQLSELYRDCADRVEAIATVYADTEVEDDARALAKRIAGALESYERDARDDRLKELRAVLGSRAVNDSAALAERVRRTMDTLEAGGRR